MTVPASVGRSITSKDEDAVKVCFRRRKNVPDVWLNRLPLPVISYVSPICPSS